MTEAQMRDVARRLDAIDRLKKEIAKDREELAFVNKHAVTGKTYRVFVKLKGEQFYNEKTEVSIELESGIVQQHFILKIAALQRKIISLGGTP